MDEDNVFAAAATPSHVPPDGEPERAILRYLRETRPWQLGMVVFYGLFGVATLGVAAFVYDVAPIVGPSDPSMETRFVTAGLGWLGVSYLICAVYAGLAAAADLRDLAGAALAVRRHRNLWRASAAITFVGVGVFTLWFLAMANAFETLGIP